MWGLCPHHPMTTCRDLFHGSARDRGEVGAWLSGAFLALLASWQSPCSHCRACDAAVNLHHQQLQKLLQKQPGGSNTLSGECSHLTKKEPFSGEFPNINTWQPLRPPQILLCQFPAKRSAASSQLPHTKLYSQWVCCRWWLGHKGEVSGNHLALGLQKEQQKL